MVRYQAFLFVTHVDGWKQFCGEWSVDPEVLLEFKIGWDKVTWTEAQAREQAFSREEAGMFLLSEASLSEESSAEEHDLPQILRVEGLVKGWHAFIDRRAESVLGNGRR
jgi:hypothetical protein